MKRERGGGRGGERERERERERRARVERLLEYELIKRKNACFQLRVQACVCVWYSGYNSQRIRKQFQLHLYRTI